MNKKNKALAARLKAVAEERLALLWDDDRFSDDVADAMNHKSWEMTEREAVEHAAQLQVQRHTASACEAARYEERMTLSAFAAIIEGKGEQ